MTVFRAATLRTFFFAFHAGAKELNDRVLQKIYLFLFAHILHYKLKTQDTLSQIGWILFESQTNLL